MPEVIIGSPSMHEIEEQVIHQVDYEVEEGKVNCDEN